MILKKILKIFGYTFLILFNYIFICFTIYIVSAILLIKDIKPQNILIKEYQRNFYQKAGLMNIWQANPDCIEFDDKIIFKPKETIFGSTKRKRFSIAFLIDNFLKVLGSTNTPSRP